VLFLSVMMRANEFIEELIHRLSCDGFSRNGSGVPLGRMYLSVTIVAFEARPRRRNTPVRSGVRWLNV
jgi:hypothetical protein